MTFSEFSSAKIIFIVVIAQKKAASYFDAAFLIFK